MKIWLNVVEINVQSKDLQINSEWIISVGFGFWVNVFFIGYTR
jgi:hypothetical protein